MQDRDHAAPIWPTPVPFSAKALHDGLEAHVTAMLAAATEGEQLAIEYHTPSGAVLHVTDVGYTSMDLLILYARDPTQQACQILVHPTALQLVLKWEQGGRPTERRPLGFLGQHGGPAGRDPAAPSAADDSRR